MLGYERIDGDYAAMRARSLAAENYTKLSRDVRDVYEGFAAGVNRFIKLHPQEFPAGMPSDFTGFDVAATELIQPPARKIRSFIDRLNQRPETRATQDDDTDDEEGEGPDDGSNAWAFAPSTLSTGRTPTARWWSRW